MGCAYDIPTSLAKSLNLSSHRVKSLNLSSHENFSGLHELYDIDNGCPTFQSIPFHRKYKILWLAFLRSTWD